MNKLKYVSLLLLFILGVASVSAQETGKNVVITLERTACFGSCPIYTVSILEDGTVLYDGKDFVTVKGEQTNQIAPETVAAMVEAFQSAGYFDWKEVYDTQSVTDLPVVITSVTRDGQTHRISHYLGDHTAPVALSFLEQWIDDMTTTSLLTGAQSDLSAISNGAESPLVTLQHGPNFGFGPVYNIVAYEDGTVVFVGLANVDNLGVHVIQTDAASVAIIGQLAQAFGYFDWQDRYDHQVMTDQSTVVTSVRWEDQYKRIERYDGDPNAPIGILRIEENIERLVGDLLPTSQ